MCVCLGFKEVEYKIWVKHKYQTEQSIFMESYIEWINNQWFKVIHQSIRRHNNIDNFQMRCIGCMYYLLQVIILMQGLFTPVNVYSCKSWCRTNLMRKHHRVFSFPLLQDKRLFLESRLRESFHVSRLSNRLCRLCHTVFSLLSHGRWVHSGENNGSRVAGTSHAGQAQMCQGCWQRRPGEGGGNGEAANLPFCRAVKQAPVLLVAHGEGRHQDYIRDL